MRLQTLVGWVALASVGAWCLADGTSSRIFVAVGFSLSALVPAWVAARRLQTPHRVIYPVVLISAVIGEFWAAETAYATLGEIDSFLTGLAALLNIPSLGLILSGAQRVAYAWVIGLFLLIVPYQGYLMARWTRVDREARSVIAYVEESRERTGVYPADLSGYRARDVAARARVAYARDPKRGYVVSYHVGSPNTSHDYSPTTGWVYYPD